MKTYKTRRSCYNCFYETDYLIPFGVAFEHYRAKENPVSGYTIDGKKVPLECTNCGLARLE